MTAPRTTGTGAVDLRSVRPTGLPEDTADALARVAWSTVVEPGDATAGSLVAMLGAARSLALVLEAVTGRASSSGTASPIVRACWDAGGVAADDLHSLEAAIDAGLERWRPRVSAIDVAEVVRTAAAVGGALVLPGDPDWPERLDDLEVHAPIVLWRRGAPPALHRPTLAVVGCRANTLAGAEAAAEITSAAADAGCSVVSGGAYGIDAVAHRVAIAADTETVAVLAGGIDQLYPTGHVELLGNVSRHGLLLAESPPGTRPTRWRFLARNRLIAALGDAVVVVEAGARSGAINTANHAAQLGRPVLAVPGAFSSPASVGCHRLIADGRATLAVHPDDPARAAITAHSGTDGFEDTALVLSGPAEDPEVIRVVDALGRRRTSTIVDVARRSGMSVAEATDALALAELQGLVRRRPDGWAAAPSPARRS